MPELELSIIMPCLNEAETIADCIGNAQRFLRENNINGEVVIGDNGSTDGSIDIAQSLGGRVVHAVTQGYGAACAAAATEASGRYIIMGDADSSYDFYHLMPFVKALRQGNDLVMGNRFKGGIEPGAMPLKNRYLGNPLLSAVGRILFSSRIGDFHCGLRGFSKTAFEKMDLKSTGMEFASEMVLKAQLLGMQFAEVPTTLSVDGRSRKPHLRPWRDGLRHLKIMFLFSPRYLFLVPGMLLMLFGLVFGTALIRGPVFIGKFGFDIGSLVYAAGFVIVGFQAALFAILAKYYGMSSGMLPVDKGVILFFNVFTMERIIFIGLLIFLVSLTGVIYSVTVWASADFGDLIPRQIISITIPAAVGAICGSELIMSGLFLGVLGLPHRLS
ncbi:MAG: glycosyltransferase family 2 protein [Desulfobulbaceae bacterium]|nr:glycosyltransferase family 2 protein [Desulfobulbaceae bacterium]